MQTIASLVERLDMSAEEAVEKLRYMLFEVEGTDSVISDEQCDILIDVDDDPELVERVRKQKLKDQDKANKRKEQLRAAGKKAAAKRKAAAAKKKAVVEEAKPAPEAEILPPEAPEAGEAKDVTAGKPMAEILPPAEPAEILPAESESTAPSSDADAPAEAAQDEPAPPAKPKAKPKKEKVKKEPSIQIGAAREEDAKPVAIIRADGTTIEAPEVELVEPEPGATADEEEEDQGLLAEAERRQEEEELRRTRQGQRPAVRPDPAVVAEVKRKAAERQRRKQVRTDGQRVTGKTARKKQRKAEKQRAEETMRRNAAAAVRETLTGGPRKRRRKRTRDESTPVEEVAAGPQMVEMDDTITVEDLAAKLEMGTNDLILELMELEIMATKNQALSLEVVRRLGELLDFEVRTVIPEEDEILTEEPDDPADLQVRAPVVTVMGHVDHGKTSLLDYIRKARVAEGEAGGITQHIAAYDVPTPNGRVVFLDTPGHEAFTQMRARGAQITDIVVLVVAADDGVMPQTVEAIDHARAAEVPIVVAVNKIDKPEAQPERIRQELTRYELVDEKWGGQTTIKDISAKTGEGIDELMELLVIEAELLELKANAKKPARGVVIESEISRGFGPVAWVLIRKGTLRIGDVFLAGATSGRVRSIISSRGEHIEEAGPSTPVLVTGFDAPPDAGDQFVAVKDERVARTIAEKRAALEKLRAGKGRHVTLEDFHSMLLAGEKKELNIVLKADVQGSVDVLTSNLSKLGNEEVRVNLVHTGVGGINESDVLLASASDAVVIGFHVTANARSQKLAETEGVDIRSYRVIYEATDDVRKALEGMLAPESREVVTGHAEVRAVFRSSSLGNIAGCYVQDGTVERNSKVRVVRDGVVVHTGEIGSLRREKDDTRSVATGFECGIKLHNFEDVKEGDILEMYRIDEVAKTLS